MNDEASAVEEEESLNISNAYLGTTDQGAIVVAEAIYALAREVRLFRKTVSSDLTKLEGRIKSLELELPVYDGCLEVKVHQ